jgi:hypothetical protein
MFVYSECFIAWHAREQKQNHRNLRIWRTSVEFDRNTNSSVSRRRGCFYTLFLWHCTLSCVDASIKKSLPQPAVETKAMRPRVAELVLSASGASAKGTTRKIGARRRTHQSRPWRTEKGSPGQQRGCAMPPVGRVNSIVNSGSKLTEPK